MVATSDWDQYVERLENFFLANDINDDAKKRAVFLSVIGPSSYKTLRNLVTPEKSADKTLAELVKVLSTHFKPKTIGDNGAFQVPQQIS